MLSVPDCVGGGLFHGWRMGLRRELQGVLSNVSFIRDGFHCEAFNCSFRKLVGLECHRFDVRKL